MLYKAYVKTGRGLWAYGLNNSEGKQVLCYFTRNSAPEPTAQVGNVWVQWVGSNYSAGIDTAYEAVKKLHEVSMSILLEGAKLGHNVGFHNLDRQVVLDYIEDLHKLLEVVSE